jgi:hypothetical protein
LWKAFNAFAPALTARVRGAATALAEKFKQPVICSKSSHICKEDQARAIQQRDRIESGLFAIPSRVEPCRTWVVRAARTTGKLELKLDWRNGIHRYFDWIGKRLGWLHLRL